ncbi:MAG: hypothetical protein RMJ33_08145 [Saprospiraceae bacterium]|nr:hypothetical protein [Saprospiraceae bacterium]MDW8229795.1 hypothetical protein [Saprospiraceae bacterium]
MRLSDLLNYRLPPIRYERIALWLFLLIVVLILLSSVSRRQRDFISEIQVDIRPLESGASLLSEREVRQRLVLAFGNTLRSTEVGGLDLHRVETVVEEDPFVADADAYVSQDNELHIRVQQREPLLRILDNNGGNYYLDKTGAMMPFSSLHTPRVLVATGNIAPYAPDFLTKKKNTLKDAFQLALLLQSDPVWSVFIQQIHLNQAGEFMLIPLIGDQKIVLGSLRNIEDKLKRLKIFYQEGMPYAGWRKYQTISLKYGGQVVCRQ